MILLIFGPILICSGTDFFPSFCMCSVEMMFLVTMPYGTGGEDTDNYNNNVICAIC